MLKTVHPFLEVSIMWGPSWVTNEKHQNINYVIINIFLAVSVTDVRDFMNDNAKQRGVALKI